MDNRKQGAYHVFAFPLKIEHIAAASRDHMSFLKGNQDRDGLTVLHNRDKRPLAALPGNPVHPEVSVEFEAFEYLLFPCIRVHCIGGEYSKA